MRGRSFSLNNMIYLKNYFHNTVKLNWPFKSSWSSGLRSKRNNALAAVGSNESITGPALVLCVSKPLVLIAGGFSVPLCIGEYI